jgi:hypothetical protein
VSGIQVSIAIKYKVGYFGEGACGDWAMFKVFSVG